MHRLFLLALPVAALACSSTEESAGADGAGVAYTGAAPAAAPPPAPAAPQRAEAMDARMARAIVTSGAQIPVSSRTTSMLIRTGTASIEVEDIARGIADARRLVGALGGHVANTGVQSGRDQVPSATLELKVPAERFDQAVNGLEPLGRVESVNVDAQDVGEEYVDVSARVGTAKRLEERLVSLLATRGARLEDILSIERELARVRGEIERYEGRLRYLDARLAMSTLTVTLHEPYPVLGHGPSPLGDAVRQAWRNFVGFVAALIASLGVIIPLGAILLGGWLLVRRARRPRAAA